MLIIALIALYCIQQNTTAAMVPISLPPFCQVCCYGCEAYTHTHTTGDQTTHPKQTLGFNIFSFIFQLGEIELALYYEICFHLLVPSEFMGQRRYTGFYNNQIDIFHIWVAGMD